MLLDGLYALLTNFGEYLYTFHIEALSTQGSNSTLVKVGGGIDPVTEVTHLGLNYPNLLTMGYCPPRL